nr:basic salivary proline-rich protein 2-like [Aegilops tauschii subsp. strangulata]
MLQQGGTSTASIHPPIAAPMPPGSHTDDPPCHRPAQTQMGPKGLDLGRAGAARSHRPAAKGSATTQKIPRHHAGEHRRRAGPPSPGSTPQRPPPRVRATREGKGQWPPPPAPPRPGPAPDASDGVKERGEGESSGRRCWRRDRSPAGATGSRDSTSDSYSPLLLSV